MPQPLEVHFETKEVDKMLNDLLNKVERPKPLLKNVERYVHAVTMKMFRGPRADTKGVRGVKWQKLAKSTLMGKKAAVKRGEAIVAARPLVLTGTMRDSIKVLERQEKGLVYGTRIKSKKGFPYPAAHNVGGSKANRPPARPWLFLTKDDYAQIVLMTVDYLKGVKG